MQQKIGTTQGFEASKIKDPLVRGFLNSATRFALQQKKPSKAVREFSKELGKTEYAQFEEKYKVPRTRLRHQLRPKNAGPIIAETKQQLELLAKDLEKAEEYWNRIFAYITKKYFKKRSNEINSALKESQWYPYLKINHLQQLHINLHREDWDYLCNQAIVFCFMPTDKKQHARYKRFDKSGRADHPCPRPHRPGHRGR